MSEGRHASTNSARIRPAYLAIGGAVVLVAAVLVFLLVRGGSSGGGGGPSALPVPSFAFRPTSIVAVPVRAGVKPATLQDKAKPAADEAVKLMNGIYVGAFLDPADWQKGAYDAVWTSFDAGAAAEAKAQVDTLTAGSGAGTAFARILPKSGTIQAKVLLDAGDHPFSILANVQFQAVGQGKDGSSLLISSTGQFVFQRVDGSWKVVSFRVIRNDTTQAPSPSAGPSGSPS